MRYKLLGKSGLRVSELCLGAMTFGEDWGAFLRGSSKEECKKIFDLFVDAGGNFIDTANNYQNGTSEKYVGEFIAPEREKFVLATKYTLTTNPSDPNASGSHRKNLFQSVETSLKRLNTHYIDFLWVHAWDYMTPIEEVMRSLDDMIRSGKVLYVGMSDAPAWVVARANTMSELQGWSPFTGLQIMYSLIERTPERELLPMARTLDIGITAWSPLGGGVLSGKYNTPYKENQEQKRFETNNPMTAAFVNERNLSIAKEVQTIAKETNKTPSQVALSWIGHQRDRGVIVPILGARTQTQMKDNLGSLDLALSSDQLERLNEISKIELGFPHSFLSSDMVKTLVYGDVYSQIDFHRGV
ncbi:MAG: aldo/keto reductase [Thermoproteota archaeon]|nr:aldo/keto reductase [Thermoproteota archaeon]